MLGTTYAVNYPRELGGFGRSPALDRLVRTTGGRQFEPGQAEAIAAEVTRQHRRVRQVRQDWGWAFLGAALLLFLAEVGVRRLRRVGTTDLSIRLPW